MTDTRLRELERKWKESGSTEDEAAYLLERVRCGDLEKEKLELAAYCGHEGAVLALGEEAPSIPTRRDHWTQGFTRWGDEVRIRAALAIEKYVFPVFQRDKPGDANRMAIRLEATERWLESLSSHPGAAGACEEGRVEPSHYHIELAFSWAMLLPESTEEELRHAVGYALVQWAIGEKDSRETWLVKSVSPYLYQRVANMIRGIFRKQ